MFNIIEVINIRILWYGVRGHANFELFAFVAQSVVKLVAKTLSPNFSKYSGFYWYQNDFAKTNVFLNWYFVQNKVGMPDA